MKKAPHLLGLFALSALVSCSSSDNPAEKTGGKTSQGGSTSAGGATATGGSGGSQSSGGATASGGASATGGTVASSGGQSSSGGASGAQSGGTTLVGGSTSTGGSTTNGGSTNVGGATATGGTTGQGGSTSTGGSKPVLKKFFGNTSPKNKPIPTDFATMWQQVTLDANSKWGYVQPSSATEWVWEPVDAVYKYAKDNGLIFKQHNFFWKAEQPGWVNDSNIMTAGPAWVEAFCKRYPDVPMIDVVNEPLPGHNVASYSKGMGGAGASGFDWVIQAFKWARQYCPNSILIINEYNIIEYDADHNAFVSMMQKLMAAGAPIDAIGAQGHDAYKVGGSKAKSYIDKLVAEFKLPVYVTEVDVTEPDDAKQLAAMKDIVNMFYDHPGVKGITFWGYIKGTMWTPRANGWLVDTDGKLRPAMTWLQEFMKSKN
jgi:endo-1,4-beta-xylanase